MACKELVDTKGGVLLDPKGQSYQVIPDGSKVSRGDVSGSRVFLDLWVNYWSHVY